MQRATPPSVEPPVYQPDWALWVRQFISIGLVIAAVYALTLLTPVVNIIITTFLLSFLVFIPARMLAIRSEKITYNGSVLIMFAIMVALLIFTLVLVVPSLAQFIRSISTSMTTEWAEFSANVQNWDPETAYMLHIGDLLEIDITQYMLPLHTFLVSSAESTTSQAAQAAAANAPSLDGMASIDFGAIIGTATQILGSVVGTFSTFISTVFMGLLLTLISLLELPRYQDRMLNSFPTHQRELRLLATRITRVWQGFFRGQLLLCFIIGVITFVQLTLMGIEAAFVVSILVALVSLIPTIGGIIALFPLALAPLLQGSVVFTDMGRIPLTLLVVLVNFVISQVIWNGVAPKIMGDAVALPLPLIFIGIIIGAAIGGALGAFLIVPILGTIRVIVQYLIAKVSRSDPYPGEEMPDIILLKKV